MDSHNELLEDIRKQVLEDFLNKLPEVIVPTSQNLLAETPLIFSVIRTSFFTCSTTLHLEIAVNLWTKSNIYAMFLFLSYGRFSMVFDQIMNFFLSVLSIISVPLQNNNEHVLSRYHLNFQSVSLIHCRVTGVCLCPRFGRYRLYMATVTIRWNFPTRRSKIEITGEHRTQMMCNQEKSFRNTCVKWT